MRLAPVLLLPRHLIAKMNHMFICESHTTPSFIHWTGTLVAVFAAGARPPFGDVLAASCSTWNLKP